MNKLIPVLGIVAVIIAGVLFLQFRKSPGQTLVPPLTKAIQIGTDVCSEFPKEWVAETIGKTIIKTDAQNSTGVNVCQYYGSETSFISIKYEALSVDNIKKGQQTLGRTVSTDPRIPMDHFIVTQEDGLINSIYLVINPNLFVAIDRSSGEILDNEKDIAFAAKVVARLQAGENVVKETSSTQPTVETGASQKALAESFLKAISDKKIPEAIAMMTSKAVPDDSTKQAWGVQYAAFKKLVVKSIEPSLAEEWTDTTQSYKVTMDVEMTPESANGPIPYYGYETGINIRWVGLEKENGVWKVAGISTGP